MAGHGGSFASYAQSSGSQNTGHDYNDFTRLSQAISSNVQKINQNVAQMNSLLSQYGTRTDSAQVHDRLHEVQHYTNQLAKDTSKCVKDLSSLPASTTVSEQRQQKIQRERLVSEFSNALASFQQAQRDEKERERLCSIQTPGKTSAASRDPFDDTPPAYQSVSPYDSRGQNQVVLQLDTSDVEFEMVREREDALRKLESDIMDVNQIFKDLGMMVHEQGDIVDSIEANVESAAVSVEQGTEQLRQARQHQSSARKKKCICITVLLVVVAIIIIILAVTLSPKSSS